MTTPETDHLDQNSFVDSEREVSDAIKTINELAQFHGLLVSIYTREDANRAAEEMDENGNPVKRPLTNREFNTLFQLWNERDGPTEFDSLSHLVRQSIEDASQNKS